MSTFLSLAYLFFIGSVCGWLLEVLYRNLTRQQEKMVNPGFCTGPYLPLYGFGLCILYLVAGLERRHIIEDPEWNHVFLLFVMAISMTAIEYVAGIVCLKFFKVRLWDYSDLPGNIQGIICPKFSIIWGIIGAVYYFVLHPHIVMAVNWLAENLAFSFVIGMFFGIFIIDVAHSANLVVRLKKLAEENQMIVRYEELKEHIRQAHVKSATRYYFFRPFKTEKPLSEHLRELQKSFEKRIRRSSDKE